MPRQAPGCQTFSHYYIITIPFHASLMYFSQSRCTYFKALSLLLVYVAYYLVQSQVKAIEVNQKYRLKGPTTIKNKYQCSVHFLHNCERKTT